MNNILCKLGLHNYIRIIWSGDIHGDSETGEVLQCKWCRKYTKWGTAFYPNYILEAIKENKTGDKE